jgi:hypothetical protein
MSTIQNNHDTHVDALNRLIDGMPLESHWRSALRTHRAKTARPRLIAGTILRTLR